MAQIATLKLLPPNAFQVLCRRNAARPSNAPNFTVFLKREGDTRRLFSLVRPTNASRSSPTRRPSSVHDAPFIGKSTKYPLRCRQKRVISSGNLDPRVKGGAPSDGNQKANTPSTSEDTSSNPRLIDTTKALGQQVRDRISVLTPHENIYTIPNILTFSRLLATPAIGYLVLHDSHVWAASLFAYAGISDLVDGWIARKYKLQTVVGSVIDPMADKALMAVLVACLAIKGALPLWLATLIFGRDVALGIAAIYYRFASLPAPKTFMRYWDFSLPSAEVHPTQVSKWNTFLQLGLIGCTIATPLVAPLDLLSAVDLETGLKGFQYLVAGTTVWSGASYLWTRDAVIILGDNEILKKKQGFRGRAIIGVSFAAVLALAAHFAFRDDQEDKVSVTS